MLCRPGPSDKSRSSVSVPRVLLHPGHITVHPALQEAAAGGADAAIGFEQPVLGLQEDFRLAIRRHVEIADDGAQVLLRAGGADGTDGDADDARRLAAERALAIRP